MLFDRAEREIGELSSSALPLFLSPLLLAMSVDVDDSVIGRRSAPPTPGLFFDPTLLLPADWRTITGVVYC